MFTDVSHRLRHNPPARHGGVAATDIDGDGRDEFVVAGFGGPNRVLRWDGRHLWDVAPRSLADTDRQAVGLAAADIDGDGREELYVLNANSSAGPGEHADRLFDHDPATGRWHDLFAHPPNRSARAASSGRSVAAVDRRGTGRYGFFVTGYDRPMRLYELGPDGHLVDLAPPLGLDLATGGRSLLVAPLASDRPDVFCGNEKGRNFLFRNTGVGTFLEIASEVGLADDGENARGVTALDADGDGRLDLAWGNWEGPHRLMVRGPDGCFHDRATPALALPGAVRNVIAADFDNDGYEELFLNLMGEPNRLFRQVPGDPGGPTEWRLDDAADATLPDGLGTGAAVADIDGDGRLELLIAHGELDAQPLRLFVWTGTDHHWLRVAPRTRFGAPARGATVRLVAGGRTQVRVVCGGSGYLGQMEPVAHFGLGAVDAVDSVRVRWPDGAEASVMAPRVRSVIEVTYPQ